MDFLLECVGFPPDTDLAELARRVQREGEPVPWRGPRGLHLRQPLAEGLEVRLDREEGAEHASLWPHFDVKRRLRVAAHELRALPDSPYDALLRGIANPASPAFDAPEALGEDYALATYLSNARQLPPRLPHAHVLAVSIAGFSLDVSFVGANEGVRDRSILDAPNGALLEPLGGEEEPGGVMELSLRVRTVRRLTNRLTGREVAVLEADAPGRPLELFVSPWQLAAEGFDLPRPGRRIEGAFLFTGRVSGGLPPTRRAPRRS